MKTGISQKNFNDYVSGNTLTLIQFQTEWNGACQIIAPLYESLAISYGDMVNFYSIDVEIEKTIAHEYRITELPTILFFREGQVIDHVMGLSPKAILVSKIEAALNNHK